MPAMTTERLRGMEVVDRERQRIGVVRDLVVDPVSGYVRHLLLGPGGALAAAGLVERIMLIPIEAVDCEGEALTVTAAVEEIKEAPSYSPYMPVRMTEEYEASIYQYWGVQPYWKSPSYRFADRPAAEFMREDVPCVSPTTRMADALARMKEHDVDSLPVLDEQGRFVGMLTASALVQALQGSQTSATSSAGANARESSRPVIVPAHEDAPATPESTEALPTSGEARRSPFRTGANGLAV